MILVVQNQSASTQLTRSKFLSVVLILPRVGCTSGLGYLPPPRHRTRPDQHTGVTSLHPTISVVLYSGLHTSTENVPATTQTAVYGTLSPFCTSIGPKVYFLHNHRSYSVRFAQPLDLQCTLGTAIGPAVYFQHNYLTYSILFAQPYHLQYTFCTTHRTYIILFAETNGVLLFKKQDLKTSLGRTNSFFP